MQHMVYSICIMQKLVFSVQYKIYQTSHIQYIVYSLQYIVYNSIHYLHILYTIYCIQQTHCIVYYIYIYIQCILCKPYVIGNISQYCGMHRLSYIIQYVHRLWSISLIQCVVDSIWYYSASTPSIQNLPYVVVYMFYRVQFIGCRMEVYKHISRLCRVYKYIHIAVIVCPVIWHT